MPVDFREESAGVVVAVWVQPRAKKDAVVGEHDGCLKVCVSAPPEDNRANKSVIKLLADFFGVRKSKVEIISGGRSRRKEVLIRGATASSVTRLLP